MTLKNGLYKVTFGTPIGEGYGVIVLRDGAILGGDSTMFYAGTYEQAAENFTASIDIATHSAVPGFGSVFGVPNAHVDLSGNIVGTSANVNGTSPQAPGVPLRASLQFLC